MKQKLNAIFMALLLCPLFSQAQTDARLIMYPDVSQDKICFSFGGDLWIVDKTGGLASRLSSPEGTERNAKFSPDGKTIAFNANYDGNFDIYTMPTNGGVPNRVTSHGMADLIQDWYGDGKSILFASSMESGKQRFAQFYKVAVSGGLPEKLPVELGAVAAISDNGEKLAFTDKSLLTRTWKRYRGGMAPDIFIMDLKTLVTENINKSIASDELPMWHGNVLYYLSDDGSPKRNNIWKYDLVTKKHSQVTFFKDFDVHYPSKGPSDIVFEAGGKLYLLNLADEKYKEVVISAIGDFASLKKTNKSVAGNLGWFQVAPDGNRVLVEARGDLFSLPKEEGFVRNLTKTSGTFERYPAWSPDGKSIAFFSDQTGEYELTILDLESGKTSSNTKLGPGFRYAIYWSPDSKKVGFIDQTMAMHVVDVKTGNDVVFDKDDNLFEGGLASFSLSWSSDSRYLTYAKSQRNNNSAVYIYDTKLKTNHQVTSGFYSDMMPCFDPEGKYIYFTSNRSFHPYYSSFDNTWTYADATQLIALPLRKDVPSPLAMKNDTVVIKKVEANEEKKEEKKEEVKSKSKKNEKLTPEEPKDTAAVVKIDFDQMEKRAVVIPVTAKNLGHLAAVAGKIIFEKYPSIAASDAETQGGGILMYYDLNDKKEVTIMEAVGSYELSSDGSSIAVMTSSGEIGVVTVAEGQKFEKKVPLHEMVMTIDPMQEWKQIFNDTWRLQRDYFYDKDMHGVNWPAMKVQYDKLIDQCVTRSDVNFVLGELIGEINASHTYRGGGDEENAKMKNVGYLGADWAKDNGEFKIKKILRGAPWDTEVISPLDEAGVGVKEGDYILAVNGELLKDFQEPWLAFEGKAGQTVELTYNSTPTMTGAKKQLVKTMGDETRLRNLAWIERNRQIVDKASGGKIGYIFVPSTGVEDGQYELVRMYYGQWDKEGLIIDERFNNGGQIPDRFVELLNKKPLAYFKTRDGKDWQWPPTGNFGPKAMLINGWSGSGGDAFPDYFRKAGLGPLIGTRTWGGLIGISGVPALIDGGSVTVPTFRMYDPDGKWFREGHGVDPDIEVLEDHEALAKGRDPQLEKAIEVVMKELNSGKKIHPVPPVKENRAE